MNNEEKRERAFLYACGALNNNEAERFEEEVRSDIDLREETYEWQKVNEQDVRDIEQVEPPFQSYAGIMSRINEEETRPAPKHSNRGSIIGYLNWGGWAIAACAVLAFALTWQGGGPVGNESPRFTVDASSSDIVLNDLGKPGRLATLAVSNAELGLEERMMEVAELAEAYWFSREGLPPAVSEEAASDKWSDGFTIFDRKYRIGFIGVENMPEARVGKFYNVWARSGSDGRAVWAGSLPMGDASRGLFFFDLSKNEEIAPIDNAVSFFVTEDRTDRPDAPQGPVVLGDI